MTMAVTELPIANTSAVHTMRISVQRRKMPQPEAAPALPQARRFDVQMTPDERAELEARGSEIVEVPFKPAFGEMRINRMPRWQAEHEPTLGNWVSKEWHKAGAVPDYQERVRLGLNNPAKGVRQSDEWSAPVLVNTLQPVAETTVRLDDNARYQFQSADKSAFLSFTNTSLRNSLGAHQQDAKGATVPTSRQNVAPGASAVLMLGEHGAVIEQSPT